MVSTILRISMLGMRGARVLLPFGLLTYLDGDLSPRAVALVMEWAMLHEDELAWLLAVGSRDEATTYDRAFELTNLKWHANSHP